MPIAGPGGCPSALRSGDLYTHCFNGTMIEDGHVAQSFHEARERGVLFDVGHGQGSFRWTVAERAAAEGFLPDIISSDMHVGGVNGIVYDQPTCLTKFLAMGMPLADVIRASTATPAAALNLRDSAGRLLGSLGVGAEADIAVFDLESVDVSLEDTCATRAPPSYLWLT